MAEGLPLDSLCPGQVILLLHAGRYPDAGNSDPWRGTPVAYELLGLPAFVLGVQLPFVYLRFPEMSPISRSIVVLDSRQGLQYVLASPTLLRSLAGIGQGTGIFGEAATPTRGAHNAEKNGGSHEEDQT